MRGRSPRRTREALVVQPRDKEILVALYIYRFLTAVHIRSLFFEGRSIRAAQLRLQKLHIHRYISRRAVLLDSSGGSSPRQKQYLYRLARRGAEHVAQLFGIPVSEVPHTAKATAKGYATIEHHLLATDFLVACQRAERDDLKRVICEPEWILRRALGRYRQQQTCGRLPVTDGAVTFFLKGKRTPVTYHLEIVRASISGGNKRLLLKLRKLIALKWRGHFEQVYGHQTIRAILIATNSQRRAAHLRALAAQLPHGRRLLWFGTYTGPPFSSDLTQIRWQDANGQWHALLPGS